jgi:thiol-disulfide isomerase/thioredoxin/sugar lactone lactonase YvrE
MSHLFSAARTAALLAVCGAPLLVPAHHSMAAPQTASPLPYDGVRAPDFPADFPWLNSKPLSLRALRGKVVLLDFWTYGCINCMHILPDLKKLEAKYPKELVVISVHSAKFQTESDAKNVRNAVLRYKIEHPVLVDQKMRVWSEYAVKAWPTLVLVDPTGKVAGQVMGEGHYDTLDATIAQLVERAKQRGELSTSPLSLTLERAKVAPAPLSFPGKVLASGGKLYIADSGHNRIVISSQSGAVEAVIGGSGAGLKDGDFATAQFENPQGMTLDGDKLYVADTNNHALRVIDLTAKTVATLAGNGKQAPYMATGGVGKTALLSSPWDVVKVGDALIMAMAGNHQIWKYDLASTKVSVYAGSGAEARRDGSFGDAAFAQTSGLALQGDRLFAADSESSTLRALDLKATTVKTVAGGDLFDFGDKDGQGDAVRLQHPLGITSDGKNLYFADTYNSKIKRLDPTTDTVSTVFSGNLSEPGGLSFDDGAIFIADTNNGAIKRLDLATKTTKVITFDGLKPPVLAALAPIAATPVVVEGQTQILAPGTSAKFVLDVKLPKGFHLNREAPLKLTAKANGSGIKFGQTTLSGAKFQLPLELPMQTAKSGKGNIDITAFISYCNDGTGAICKVESVKRRVDFEVRDGGATEIRVGVDLP